MPFGQMVAPLLTSLALTVVLAVVALYALYWVVRKAVAHGIRDARRAATPRTGAEVPARAG